MRLLLDLIAPTAGSATAARARQPRAQPRDPAAGRVPSRRLRAVSEAHRCGDARLSGRAARRRRHARPGRAGRAVRRPTRPAVAGAVDGQSPEARADPGVHARARAADPRRADRRARPARPAELPRPARRGGRGGPHGIPLLAHAVGGRAGAAPGRDTARGPARRRRLAREPARDRGAKARDRVRGRAPAGRRAPGAARRPGGDARAVALRGRVRGLRRPARQGASRATRSGRSAAATTTSRRSSCATTGRTSPA